MSKELTQEYIGKLLGPDLRRDAIHIAVAPACATTQVWPGQHVNVSGATDKPHIGIVDPFLVGPVYPGERYFIFLYPNTITGLRHEWTHPAFETVAPEKISQLDHLGKSRAWIADHANTLGLSADVLMENAAEWLVTDEHFVQHGSELWRDYFNPKEFWHHYEIVTGTVVEAEKKRSFYCCTC